MKKILTLLLCAICLAPSVVRAQSNTIERFSNKRNVRAATIGRGMSLFMSEDLCQQFNIGAISNKVDVLQYVSPKRRPLCRRMVRRARAEQRQNGYMEIMKYNRGAKRVSLCARGTDGKQKEVSLLIRKKRPSRDAVLMYIKGDLDPLDFEKLLRKK